MSVSTQATFETGHTDQIHDCQYDYYGRVRAIRARRAERGGRRTRTASRFEPRDDQRSVCYPQIIIQMATSSDGKKAQKSH